MSNQKVSAIFAAIFTYLITLVSFGIYLILDANMWGLIPFFAGPIGTYFAMNWLMQRDTL